MVKKVLVLILGFGMIATGVAGIATTLVDRKNAAALKELDQARKEFQLASIEEEEKQEKEREEIEKLAQVLQQEKQELEEERRSIEKMRRSAEEAIEENKRAARTPAPLPPASGKVLAKAGDSGKRQSVDSKAQKKPTEKSISREGSRRLATTKAPGRGVEDDAFRDITRKAAMEAARLSEPVEYHNRYTHEVVLAEPFDFERGLVRVRIRVWKDNRLVKDRVIRFSKDSISKFSKTSA